MGQSVAEKRDTKESTSWSDLEDIVKKQFELDAIGISKESRQNSDHARAEKILQETSKRTADEWERGLYMDDGPPFLRLPPEEWPEMTSCVATEESTHEIRSTRASTCNDGATRTAD
ncbi:hypothetical protein ACJJTC_003954 [Scirpophaga incertulas]